MYQSKGRADDASMDPLDGTKWRRDGLGDASQAPSWVIIFHVGYHGEPAALKVVKES